MCAESNLLSTLGRGAAYVGARAPKCQYRSRYGRIALYELEIRAWREWSLKALLVSDLKGASVNSPKIEQAHVSVEKGGQLIVGDMPRQQLQPECLIQRLRTHSRGAKAQAQRWDGSIALDWHRIAKIHDSLADNLEKWSKMYVGES